MNMPAKTKTAPSTRTKVIAKKPRKTAKTAGKPTPKPKRSKQIQGSRGPLGVGIIGAGLMGRIHGECFFRDPRGNVVGCYNPTRSKAEQLVKDFGGKVHDSVESLLADPAVGAVVVASPQSYHADQLVAIAKAGKHIYTEKPVALTVAELDAVERAVAKAKVAVAVNHQMRLHPVIKAVRANLDKLGAIYHLDMEWCFKIDAHEGRCWTNYHQGGFFMELGCHANDLAQFLLGPVQNVTGHSVRMNPKRATEDYTHSLMQFQSNAVASIIVSANHRTKRQGLLIGRVLGEKGRIDFTCYPYARGMNKATLTVDVGKSVFVPDEKKTLLKIENRPSMSKDYKGFFDVYQQQAEAFLDQIFKGLPPVCSLAEGRAAVELVLATYDAQAQHTRKPNFVKPPKRYETKAAAHPIVRRK